MFELWIEVALLERRIEMPRVHCNNCEFDICDFCMHYNFNGEWYANGSDGSHGPIYVGEGYCRLTGCYSDPIDDCDNFHCFMAKTPIDKGE